jgi:gamma-glutamyltranspeptidase/glutathione hydrolase
VNRRAARALVGWLALVLGAGSVAERAVAPRNDQHAWGRHGAVVSVEPHATRIGLDVLRQGGNAVDAAVAVFLALAVTHPQAGNLGGGAFFVIRMADGTATTIDCRETAPAAAHRDLYLRADGSVDPDRSLVGATAAAVPGSPAGLLLALAKHGSQSLAKLAAPAIALARDGFAVDPFLADDLADARRLLGRFAATRAVFFAGDRPLQAGERLVQPALAATLTRLAEGGFDGFYRGETARLVAAQMQRDGGYVTAEDLANYAAKERPALRGSYRGYEVVTMPPPSSGGVALLQMMNLLEPYDLAGSGWGSSRTLHLLIEAMKRAYADRARWLGDPDHFAVPTAGLVSKAYADTLRQSLRTDQATVVAPGQPPGAPEGEHTTHFSVVDAAGNAVACTTTINSTFGAGLVVDGAGFLLNNEMDDFAAKPGVPNQFGLVGGKANAIAAGKRPLSSMTPTLLVRDGKVRFVVGSPGGGRIINTVLQVALNVVDHGMPLEHAVRVPRIHHQWSPDELQWERNALVEDVRARLTEMGHRFAPTPRSVGQCQAIEVTPSGKRIAVADPRTGGTAAAY